MARQRPDTSDRVIDEDMSHQPRHMAPSRGVRRAPPSGGMAGSIAGGTNGHARPTSASNGAAAAPSVRSRVAARVADPSRGPAPELLFKRRVRPLPMLRELLGAKELIRALVERDFRARYKQTKVGVAWAVLTPVLLMGAFSIFANTAADFDTNGVPYPLFAYLALVPWTFFSSSVAQGSTSIISNLALVNKVYCPREVFPLAAIGIAAVDAVISLSVLGVLFVVYGEAPQATSVWVPVLLAVQLVFTMGVALLLSGLVVYLRDLRQILPMVLQFALFATPVAYGFDVLDEKWQPLASAVNPLAPVIDGYRRTVLDGQPPAWGLVGIAAAVSTVWLVGGYLLFKRLETGFADVA